jgi:hypothetical protein
MTLGTEAARCFPPLRVNAYAQTMLRETLAGTGRDLPAWSLPTDPSWTEVARCSARLPSVDEKTMTLVVATGTGRDLPVWSLPTDPSWTEVARCSVRLPSATWRRTEMG